VLVEIFTVPGLSSAASTRGIGCAADRIGFADTAYLSRPGPSGL